VPDDVVDEPGEQDLEPFGLVLVLPHEPIEQGQRLNLVLDDDLLGLLGLDLGLEPGLGGPGLRLFQFRRLECP